MKFCSGPWTSLGRLWIWDTNLPCCYVVTNVDVIYHRTGSINTPQEKEIEVQEELVWLRWTSCLDLTAWLGSLLCPVSSNPIRWLPECPEQSKGSCVRMRGTLSRMPLSPQRTQPHFPFHAAEQDSETVFLFAWKAVKRRHGFVKCLSSFL